MINIYFIFITTTLYLIYFSTSYYILNSSIITLYLKEFDEMILSIKSLINDIDEVKVNVLVDDDINIIIIYSILV